MKTVMELMEMLKNLDPTMPIVVEKDDVETGWHYDGVKKIEPEVVRMTEVRCLDSFDGTAFSTKQLMSCSIEKPNAFNVLVIK